MIWRKGAEMLEISLPSFVRRIDCLPAPRSDTAPGTHGGTSFSRIGPILAHTCSKWSLLMCGYFLS